MNFTYPAKIKKGNDGRYLVTFRDLPFGVTDGATVEKAKTEAVDCLETVIASCVKDKEKIPVPSKPQKEEYLIDLPAQTAAKTALYIAIKKSGLSNSELARRLGANEKEIRRMIDPWHPTKLPRIEKAMAELGYVIRISVLEPAA